MKRFDVEPGRMVAFSLIFSAIVIWQFHLGWAWWLPVLAGNAAVFYAGNVVYVGANRRIQRIARGE